MGGFSIPGSSDMRAAYYANRMNGGAPEVTYIPSTGVLPQSQRGDGLSNPALEPLPTPATNIPDYVGPNPAYTQLSPGAGFGGTPAAVANIAANFLQGWTQGKNVSEARQRQQAQQKIAAAFTGYNTARSSAQTLANQIGSLQQKYSGKPVEQWGNAADQEAFSQLNDAFKTVSATVPGFASLYADQIRAFGGGAPKVKGGKVANGQQGGHPLEQFVEPALQHLENHPPITLPPAPMQQGPASSMTATAGGAPSSTPGVVGAVGEMSAMPATAGSPVQTSTASPSSAGAVKVLGGVRTPNQLESVTPPTSAPGVVGSVFQIGETPTIPGATAIPRLAAQASGEQPAQQPGTAGHMAGIARNIAGAAEHGLGRMFLPRKPDFFAPGTADLWLKANGNIPITADPELMAKLQQERGAAATAGAQGQQAQTSAGMMAEFAQAQHNVADQLRTNPNYLSTPEGKAASAHLAVLGGGLKGLSPTEALSSEDQAAFNAAKAQFMSGSIKAIQSGNYDYFQAAALGLEPKDELQAFMAAYPGRPEQAIKQYTDMRIKEYQGMWAGRLTPAGEYDRLLQQEVDALQAANPGADPTQLRQQAMTMLAQSGVTPNRGSAGFGAGARTKVIQPRDVPYAQQELLQALSRNPNYADYLKATPKNGVNYYEFAQQPVNHWYNTTNDADVQKWQAGRQQMLGDAQAMLQQQGYDDASIARILGEPAVQNGNRPGATQTSNTPQGSGKWYNVTIPGQGTQRRFIRDAELSRVQGAMPQGGTIVATQ